MASDTIDACAALFAGAGRTLRTGMRAVFARLAALGVRQIIMLTGDNKHVAKAVAASVGISDVRAGMLPKEKLNLPLRSAARQQRDGFAGALIGGAQCIALGFLILKIRIKRRRLTS